MVPGVQEADDLIEKELMRSRFLRLIADLVRGEITRTTFVPWEVELMLDISVCVVDSKMRAGLLLQYQRAVDRQLDEGPGPPIKFSEFLQSRTTRRP